MPTLPAVITALITPMHTNGNIDFTSLLQLVDRQIEAGVDAILLLGTTGESPTLTTSEKKQLITTVMAHVASRIPVWLGTGSNCTRSTIEATQYAADQGAAAALMVNPYYNKPTQAGLMAHYQAVAHAVDIPQVIYNIPGRTSGALSLETVTALSKHTNIIGIKDCDPDPHRVSKLRSQVTKDFAIWSGDDPTLEHCIASGGQGIVSVAANVSPQAMVTYYQALQQNDTAGVMAIQQTLAPLFEALFVESNPIPCKWILAKMGLIPPGIRLPLTPLSITAQTLVQQLLPHLR